MVRHHLQHSRSSRHSSRHHQDHGQLERQTQHRSRVPSPNNLARSLPQQRVLHGKFKKESNSLLQKRRRNRIRDRSCQNPFFNISLNDKPILLTSGSPHTSSSQKSEPVPKRSYSLNRTPSAKNGSAKSPCFLAVTPIFESVS